MATFQKDPLTGAYIVQQGDTLSKIATTQGRTLQELLATNPQYAANPNLIRPGQVVNPQTTTTAPTYNNLVGTTIPTKAPVNNPTVSFTDALIKILKDAQGTNLTGQEALMRQSQGLTGRGITDAARIFKNPLLTPDAGTSLGLNAPNVYSPGITSIENQQRLAAQGLGDMTDIINASRDQYNTEEEAMARTQEKEKTSTTEQPMMSTKSISALKAALSASKFEGPEADGKYADPTLYLENYKSWLASGGTEEMFFKNFPPSTYINPANTWLPPEIMKFVKQPATADFDITNANWGQ